MMEPVHERVIIGYELEIMETEAAKDSEEETEVDIKQTRGRNAGASPVAFQDKGFGSHDSTLRGQKASTLVHNEGLLTSLHASDATLNKEDDRSNRSFKFDNATPMDQQAPNVHDSGGYGDARSSGLQIQKVNVPSPNNNLSTPFSNAKRSADSDGSKFRGPSYSRKTLRRSELSLHSGDTAKSGGDGSFSGDAGKHEVDGCIEVSACKEKDVKKGAFVCDKALILESRFGEVGSTGSLFHKRKIEGHLEVCPGSSKSPKLGASTSKSVNEVESTILVNSSIGTIESVLAMVQSGNHMKEETAAPSPTTNVLTNEPFSNNKRMESDIPVSRNLTVEILEGSPVKNEEASKVTTTAVSPKNSPFISGGPMSNSKEKGDPQNQQTSVNISSSSNNNVEITDSGIPILNCNSVKKEEESKATTTAVTPKTSPSISGGPISNSKEKGDPQNQQTSVHISSSGNKDVVITNGSPILNSDSSTVKTPLPKMKMVAQKTLGPRQHLRLGNASYRRASILVAAPVPQADASTSFHEIQATDCSKSRDGEMSEMGSTCKAVVAALQAENNLNNIGNFTDDESKAPPGLELVENNEKPGRAQASVDDALKSCRAVKDLREGSGASDNAGEKNGQGGSASEPGPLKHKLGKRKKTVVSKITRKPNRSILNVVEPEVIVSTEEGEEERKDEKKRIAKPTGKTRNGRLLKNKSNELEEVEKENRPIVSSCQNATKDRKGKGSSESSPVGKRNKDVNNKLQRAGVVKVVKQLAWFILSGHRLQRKEFQKIIRRLKGRLCRDSHQWSYQATHFVLPDPVRRTEKFFAAAASGSWILKTEYMTDSNNAGKLLPEEPYEWYKNDLSEDGAINLEGPRKWRLLREKTGHGAFYGMRIIIYGECIAPPLDTLKRVVKAGDGTILATSPPYTRFLNSGVDFAIVSPGMPRVDIWVQEFLRHEIPCVLADYLVDYVCKPGYSLDKHVQYNTHEWASKSLAKLLRLSEEIVAEVEDEEPSTPQVQVVHDLSCRVCGSTDRGEVMLICGDESGSRGCGVGTHIDCCDPPLEDVPEEDWFCSECVGGRVEANSPRTSKRRASTSKRK